MKVKLLVNQTEFDLLGSGDEEEVLLEAGTVFETLPNPRYASDNLVALRTALPWQAHIQVAFVRKEEVEVVEG